MSNPNQIQSREKVTRYAYAAVCIGSLAIGLGITGHKASAVKKEPSPNKHAAIDVGFQNSEDNLSASKIDKVKALVNLTESQQKFILFTLPKIIHRKQQGEPINVPVVEAQTIVETHFGENAPGNEYFGVKAYGEKIASGISNTQEKINGKYIQTQAAFRHYSSFDGSLDDYVQMIKTAPWYGDARQAHGWRSYLYGLQHDNKYFDNDGKPLIYASAGEDYTKLITSVIEEDHLVELAS